MLIVFLVTGVTRAAQSLEPLGATLMAVRTTDLGIRMRVAQWEARSVVIKASGHRLPVAFGMAIHTDFAKRANMLVILLVAGITIRTSLFEHHALVTVLALGFSVLTQQREARLVVIEPRWLLPVGLAMTRGAVVSQRLLVLIVRPVAIPALLRQLLPVQGAGMAIATSNLAMLASQDERGIRIVTESHLSP